VPAPAAGSRVNCTCIIRSEAGNSFIPASITMNSTPAWTGEFRNSSSTLSNTSEAKKPDHRNLVTARRRSHAEACQRREWPGQTLHSYLHPGKTMTKAVDIHFICTGLLRLQGRTGPSRALQRYQDGVEPVSQSRPMLCAFCVNRDLNALQLLDRARPLRPRFERPTY
jgi:hypothetical protein